MNNNHKRALQKNHNVLCDGLELDADLEANLVYYGVFSEAKLEEIKAETSNKQRIQKMLKALQRRGPTAFDKFLICINEHYPWLEKKLRKSYNDELNNTAPSSADLALKRKVELMVHDKFGKRKQLSKDDKQEISNFLLSHLRQQPGQDSDNIHSEYHKQPILRKVFFMLINVNTNGDSTDPLNVPEEVSLDMIESEISRISKHLRSLETQLEHYKTIDISGKTRPIEEQIRCLEKQLDYYKTLDVGDTTKSLHEIVNLAATNELKLKDSQEELAQLKELLLDKDSTIEENKERIENMYSEIEELKQKCKQLIYKESFPQLSPRNRPTKFERVLLQRSDLVHEDVQDKNSGSRFPSLRHQTNSSQPKNQVKFKSERYPNGIGIRGSNIQSPWRC